MSNCLSSSYSYIYVSLSTQPTGRAIQVEGGYGERLPSIDTRPPRMRDSDAIIEVSLNFFSHFEWCFY